VLALAAVLMPAGAPAGQSSQATATPFAQVAAGLYHSCALLDAGTLPAPASRPVRCWGFTGDGQIGYANPAVIGDDETPASAGPVDLGAGRSAIALAAGDYHSCAVLDDGNVRCWGYGNEGQLGQSSRSQIGDNETPGSVPPVRLGAGRTATAISAGGNHTCAVLDNGALRCWGLGEYGQLGRGGTGSIGDGEHVDTVDPIDLDGHLATAVTAGLGHSCAILDDGGVRCWGLGNNGQLGYANTDAVLNANSVESLDLGAGRTAKAITAGAAHTCAVLDDGSVRCWGLNEFGQLGYGNTISRGDNETPGSVAPVDLGAGRTAIAISAGGDHTCAVLDNGQVRCWGSRLFGQLGTGVLQHIGDNETPGSVAPVDLGVGRTATAVVAGIYHSCARLDNGAVRCWGEGADGRLGLCSLDDIGDDELPTAVGTVDIGFGGQACPVVPPPPPPPAAPPPPPPVAVPPPPPPAAVVTPADPLVVQEERAQALRECLAEVRAKARTERATAMRRFPRGSRQRNLALRQTETRAAARRNACLRRFGRTPGRVTALAARTPSAGRVVLTFRAPGSDGSKAPAARRYLVKQSLTPIRTAADFRRAPALCSGGCSFPAIRLRARLTLQVKDLRRRTTYYYAVAARDNVSGRIGPRSATVRVRTR
jgi:alpha-tubulin suppressor-like RCC1 family protein